MSKPTRVLYLDLDGTVRKGLDELGRFVNGPDDVEIFPEVPEILRAFKKGGWRICGISNQGGIALGHTTLEKVCEALIKTNNLLDMAFEIIAICKHHPDAADPEMAVCWCRKPRIGLIVESTLIMAAQFNEYYPPHLALFVGDREEDMGCALNANISFIWAKEWRALKGKDLQDLIEKA